MEEGEHGLWYEIHDGDARGKVAQGKRNTRGLVFAMCFFDNQAHILSILFSTPREEIGLMKR